MVFFNDKMNVLYASINYFVSMYRFEFRHEKYFKCDFSQLNVILLAKAILVAHQKLFPHWKHIFTIFLLSAYICE